MELVAAVTALCAFFTVTALASVTPCNQGNDTLCLTGVKAILRSSNWWFGDTYASECPEEVRKWKFECKNPDPDRTKVGDRIFQRHDYETDTITQVLRMRYNVKGGTYIACGHRFKVRPLISSRDVDSTDIIHYDSWTMTHRSAISWNHTGATFYTLLAYNVGELQLAGLWVNIHGGDSAQGHELHPYQGLLNPFDRASLQAFVLFKQRDFIGVNRYDLIQNNIQLYLKQNYGIYRLDNLLAIVPDIKDPMAVGFFAVQSDPFSIEYHRNLNNVNNCPWLIQRLRPEAIEIIATLNISDGNPAGALQHLELDVQVEFSSDALSYTACCVDVHVQDKMVRVDPLSKIPIPPVYLRREPWVKLDKVESSDAFFFFYDSYFSLFMLDVSEMMKQTNSSHPTLLWHVADIEEAYPSDSGITKSSYVKPLPAIDRNDSSTFVFLVFRQNIGAMGNISLDQYCSQRNSSFCELEVQRLVSDYNLTLSGFTIFTSEPDLYSRMLMYTSDLANKSDACSVEPKYSEPCPVPVVCKPTTPRSTTTLPTTTPPPPITDNAKPTSVNPTKITDATTFAPPGTQPPRTATEKPAAGGNRAAKSSASLFVILASFLPFILVNSKI